MSSNSRIIVKKVIVESSNRRVKSLFAAGAAFGEVQVSFFVAGAVLGEVVVSLFVAGAAFAEAQVSLFVAGTASGDVQVSFFVAGAVYAGHVTFRGRRTFR